MFVHIGMDMMIYNDDIIAIIDYDTVKNKAGKELVARCQKEGKYYEISKTDKKSLVLTNQKLFCFPNFHDDTEKRADNVTDFGEDDLTEQETE